MTQHTCVVSCSTTVGWPLLLRDAWEYFTPQDVAPYFDLAYNLFCHRLKKLQSAKRALKPAEAKELQFMLQTLIDTKQMLYDANDEI